MGLLIGGAGYTNCLHCDGSNCQFPDHLASLVVIGGLCALSTFPVAGVYSQVCCWMVVDSS